MGSARISLLQLGSARTTRPEHPCTRACHIHSDIHLILQVPADLRSVSNSHFEFAVSNGDRVHLLAYKLVDAAEVQRDRVARKVGVATGHEREAAMQLDIFAEDKRKIGSVVVAVGGDFAGAAGHDRGVGTDLSVARQPFG